MRHLGVHGRVAVARDAQARLAEEAVTNEALEERLEQDLKEEAVDGDDGEEVAEAARVGAPGVDLERGGVQQGREHTEEGEHDADQDRGGEHDEKMEGVRAEALAPRRLQVSPRHVAGIGRAHHRDPVRLVVRAAASKPPPQHVRLLHRPRPLLRRAKRDEGEVEQVRLQWLPPGAFAPHVQLRHPRRRLGVRRRQLGHGGRRRLCAVTCVSELSVDALELLARDLQVEAARRLHRHHGARACHGRQVVQRRGGQPLAAAPPG